MSVRTRAGRWVSRETRTEDARGQTVLFVHYGGEGIRGSERCLLDLMAGLDRSRFVPVLWCNARTLAEEAKRMGIRAVLGTAWDERSGSLLPARSLVSEARALLDTHRVALIHANGSVPIKWLVPAARAAHIPIVAHLQALEPRDWRRDLFLNQATHVVGVSAAAAESARDHGLAADAVSVIHAGVDPGLADGPVDMCWRHRLGLAPTTRTLVAVGDLEETRGVDTLVRALAGLRVAGRDVALVVLGDGPQRAALDELSGALGVADHVHFLRQQRDVGLALRSLGHVFVSASRVDAFPLAVLQAACCGLPPILSDIAAHRELAAPELTATLVPPDDDAAFADAAARFLDDDALRSRAGEAARARVLAEFTLARYVSRFEELYAGLLSRPRREYGWWSGSRWPGSSAGLLTRARRLGHALGSLVRARTLVDRSPTPRSLALGSGR